MRIYVGELGAHHRQQSSFVAPVEWPFTAADALRHCIVFLLLLTARAHLIIHTAPQSLKKKRKRKKNNNNRKKNYSSSFFKKINKVEAFSWRAPAVKANHNERGNLIFYASLLYHFLVPLSLFFVVVVGRCLSIIGIVYYSEDSVSYFSLFVVKISCKMKGPRTSEIFKIKTLNKTKNSSRLR